TRDRSGRVLEIAVTLAAPAAVGVHPHRRREAVAVEERARELAVVPFLEQPVAEPDALGLALCLRAGDAPADLPAECVVPVRYRVLQLPVRPVHVHADQAVDVVVAVVLADAAPVDLRRAVAVRVVGELPAAEGDVRLARVGPRRDRVDDLARTVPDRTLRD